VKKYKKEEKKEQVVKLLQNSVPAVSHDSTWLKFVNNWLWQLTIWDSGCSNFFGHNTSSGIVNLEPSF
jgi:hypothetical protein